MTSVIRNLLSLTASAAVLAVAAGAAQASSFAIRSGQGAEGLGMAYAGAASGGIGLAAMAWNPAAITMFAGRQSNWNATYLAASAKYGNVATNIAPVTALGGSDNLGINGAFIPASYNSWQVTDRLFIGLTNTAPYGLRSKPGGSDGIWAGQNYGRSATIRSVNISPTVGYKINDWISVGAAIQMQYMQVDQKQAVAPAPGNLQLRGDSYDFGYRLGVTLTPFAGTTIGIAYRSAITQTISGWAATQGAPLLAGTRFSRVKLDLPTPASVVAGISHTFNDRWQGHLGVEWTQWSALKAIPVTNANGVPLFVGPNAAVIRFNYRDSWYVSGGVEYKYSQALTLRAGVAYEWSAVTDRTRSVFISDNNRLWLSAGLSYKATDKMTFDLGYTYIAVNKARINYNGVTPTPGGLLLTATASPSIHVVSAGLTYRWDDPTVAQSVVSKSAPISVRY
ncbi:MAG: outer membrane protein transport protein [Beijerinckiaceae bacterium]|jgi:long-chain fatty acid transport protein|nr:outer membrane protein transport protein [Beijerinckiaceae bacterium]